jgi:hypothetical protein
MFVMQETATQELISIREQKMLRKQKFQHWDLPAHISARGNCICGMHKVSLMQALILSSLNSKYSLEGTAHTRCMQWQTLSSIPARD